MDVLRHLDDHVGFDAPPIDELHRRRSVLRVTFNCTSIGPCDQRFGSGIAQRPIVCEMTIIRIRKPRRHLPADHRGLYSFCPRPRVFVGHEGHRSDFTRTMTGLAVLLQNRKNVLIKCYGTGIFPNRCFHRSGHARDSHCQQSNEDHAFP